MSDRWNAGSRWSSAREREERERAREAEREAQRQARADRAAGRAAPPETGSEPSATRQASQRRLTDEERRTIREYRFPTSTPRSTGSERRTRVQSSEPSSDAGSQPGAGADETARGGPIGRKWRSSIEPSGSGNGEAVALPDLPAAGRSRGASGVSGRLLGFGGALFGLMALVAFLPFGPFRGNDDRPQVPTSSANISSVLGTSTPSTDANAQATEEAGPAPPPDSEQVVCIDAGHGGWDTGFVRSTGEDPPYSSPTFNEAELNLGMAMMLRDELEENGITVVMTRVTGGAVNIFDRDINEDGETRLDFEEVQRAEQAGDRDELQARINICNEANADVLISVHLNGFDDRTVRGYEVIYTAAPARENGAQNERLARAVYRRLDAAMRESAYGGGLGRDALPDTEVDSVQHEFGTEEHYIMTGPGVNNAEYTIRPSEMPGIIVEGLFISNDQDAAFVADPANQRLMVEAYAQGIMDYFEQSPG